MDSGDDHPEVLEEDLHKRIEEANENVLSGEGRKQLKIVTDEHK